MYVCCVEIYIPSHSWIQVSVPEAKRPLKKLIQERNGYQVQLYSGYQVYYIYYKLHVTGITLLRCNFYVRVAAVAVGQRRLCSCNGFMAGSGM